MSGPAFAVQKAEAAALKAYAPLTALIADRVYDEIAVEALFPYVQIGEHQEVGDDDDCEERSRVVSRVHGWSRAVGFPEVKQIASAVRGCMRQSVLVVDGFHIDNIKHQQTLFMRDRDGRTLHSVSEFVYLVSHL
jgi:Protein of unknown function (DUF3168)